MLRHRVAGVPLSAARLLRGRPRLSLNAKARVARADQDYILRDDDLLMPPVPPMPPVQTPLKLNRYFVELSKPLKIVLAYDDDTNQVVVHKVAQDCQAEAAAIVQPGDVLVRVESLVVDNGKWRPRQIGRLVVALNASAPPGVKLVFQRPDTIVGRRPRYMWYAEGCSADMTTRAADNALLPPLVVVHISPSDIAWPGRPLAVSFHNSAFNRASCMRHLQRSQAWRDATLHCIRNKPLLMFRARGGGQDASIGPQVVRPSKSFASDLPLVDTKDSVMANVVPFKTASQSGQDERRTATRTVRAFLPWVLLSIGRLDIADVRHVAVEFGLRNILEISIRLCDLRRPCLMQPAPGSSLDHFIECVAAIHRHAVAQGLTARDARAPKGCVVMLHCARNMECAAATILAAYLHWHGCVSLQESLQLTQQACGCAVDTNLLMRATAKLAKEAGMRRQYKKIVWPYGGAEVTLVTHTKGSRSWQTQTAFADGDGNGVGVKALARREDAKTAASWATERGNGTSCASSSGGAQAVLEMRGTSCFPMSRDDSGNHVLSVQVHPQKHPESLWYSFLSDDVLNVDPAAPHERGPGNCFMNVMRGPQLRNDSASQLRSARREAAIRALHFGWVAAAAETASGGSSGNNSQNGDPKASTQ